MTDIECLRLENNDKLPAHTSVGGYQLYYVTADNGILCPTCANQKDVDFSLYDIIVKAEINYESLLHCDHCSKQIDASYGVYEEE